LNTYRGLHARFYDVIYADKPYDREAGFVIDRLDDFGVDLGTLLDVACGTGRHAREFKKLGIAVTGVDYSADLLEVARDRGDDIEYVEQDMRELDLGERRFDAVTCLFDSIGYPQSDDGVVAALSAMRGCLAEGGAAAIEFLHAPALRSASSPVRVRRFDTLDGGTLLRISETELRDDVMHVSYDVVHLAPDQTWEREQETQSNRFFEVDVMRDLMERAGYTELRFVPAYQPDGPIDADVFHVLAVGR
jgi:SAM-dependent methyltransferase